MIRHRRINIGWIFIIAVVFFCSSVGVFASTKLLGGKFCNQERTNWCWVASARNAVICEKHMGNTTAALDRHQEGAVKHVKGSVVNKGGTLAETKTAVSYFSHNLLSYTTKSSKLTFTNIRKLIDNKRPIIAGASIYDSSGVARSGHMTLIVGYVNNFSEATNRISYYDPAGSGSLKGCLYKAFCDGMANGRRFDGAVYKSGVL